MGTSKITSKGRVTIPHALRRAADLKTGDELVFSLDGDHIIATKLKTAKDSYLSSVSLNLEEWLSDEDEEAWSDL
jgi:AbrB family looped-hinge helix DNA binding protein